MAHVLDSFMSICLKTQRKTSSALENNIKARLANTLHVLMILLIYLGVSIFHYKIRRVKINARIDPAQNLPGKCIIPSSRYLLLYHIYFL